MRMYRDFFIAVLSLLACLGLASTSFAALPVYLDTTDNGEGVNGYSSVATIGGTDVAQFHELTSFSGEFTKGGCSEIVVTKPTDPASPQLIAAVVSGKEFRQITAYFFRNNPVDGSTEQLLRIDLFNVVIASLGIDEVLESAAEDATLPSIEKITLVADSISVTDVLMGNSTVVTCTKVKTK